MDKSKVSKVGLHSQLQVVQSFWSEARGYFGWVFDFKPTCNLCPPQASMCMSVLPRQCTSVDNHKKTPLSNTVTSSEHVSPHNWRETTDPKHSEWFWFITTSFRKVLLWIMIESHILMTCLINWLNECLDFPLPWFAINHLSSDLRSQQSQWEPYRNTETNPPC